MSVLSSQDIAKKTIGYNDLQISNGIFYWTESRPWQQGKTFIVSMDSDGCKKDETTQDYNVTTNVHGYGGGSFYVKNHILYFMDSISGCIFRKCLSGKNEIHKVTIESGFSYADFCLDNENKNIYCLRLNKNTNKNFYPTEIVQIEIETGMQNVLFSGADFYSNIRLNENEDQLLFLQWNYPNMPWDENELWIANINKQKNISHIKKIYHQEKSSVYQPIFHKNKIYASINNKNYWQIVQIFENKIEEVCAYNADFGRPLWLAATKTFSFISEDQIVSTACENGIWKTFLINIHKKSIKEIKNNLTCIQNMDANSENGLFIGGNATSELGVFQVNLRNFNKLNLTKKEIQNTNVSIPKLLEFKSNGKNVFAFYYPPNLQENNTQQKNFENSACIIKIHGGPTSAAELIYNPKIQYYTQRGFAYVELNYGGSSGFGKEYRERLNKQWGIVDVQDTIACAEYLIQSKLASPHKLILAGSSAGGFTLLNTLSRCSLFCAGSCHYGVADLIELANHIHKFEACYDQNLIGDTIENNIQLYRDRSPINFAHKIKTPIIFFHGTNDLVVNINQTLTMAERIKQNNIQTEVYTYEGEGHGFKKEETIIHVLEKELAFFDKYLT
jgi:dienelactone hydrolase